jgi:hypothetical protein
VCRQGREKEKEMRVSVPRKGQEMGMGFNAIRKMTADIGKENKKIERRGMASNRIVRNRFDMADHATVRFLDPS